MIVLLLLIHIKFVMEYTVSYAVTNSCRDVRNQCGFRILISETLYEIEMENPGYWLK